MVFEVFGPQVLIQRSSLPTSRHSWQGEFRDVKTHYSSISMLHLKHLQMSFSTERTPSFPLFTCVVVPVRNRSPIFSFTTSQFDVRARYVQFGSRFTGRVGLLGFVGAAFICWEFWASFGG